MNIEPRTGHENGAMVAKKTWARKKASIAKVATLWTSVAAPMTPAGMSTTWAAALKKPVTMMRLVAPRARR